MPEVILIGDSIRMGYQDAVQQELGGAATVWGPEENGGNSRNVLNHLDEWVLARKPDLVHVNCGLHDLKKEFDGSGPPVPLDEYEANVREILQRCKQGTEAVTVWATTTPVNEDWHHRTKGFDRFEADVDAYNRAGLAVARDRGVTVSDLHEAVMRSGRDELLSEDGAHFTDEGYAVLGRTVAGCVRFELML